MLGILQPALRLSRPAESPLDGRKWSVVSVTDLGNAWAADALCCCDVERRLYCCHVAIRHDGINPPLRPMYVRGTRLGKCSTRRETIENVKSKIIQNLKSPWPMVPFAPKIGQQNAQVRCVATKNRKSKIKIVDLNRYPTLSN